MSKIIVSKITKIDTEAVKTAYGDNINLAVILPIEGSKMSVVTPRIAEEDGTARLAISKRDLKELLKMLKDDEDDAAAEIEILLPSKTV